MRTPRRVMAPWEPTAAELDAIHGHAPQTEGNINDSDFDFCDAPDKGGVFAVWAGIANQRSNPYFNIGGLVNGTTSQEWLEGYFTSGSPAKSSEAHSPLKSDDDTTTVVRRPVQASDTTLPRVGICKYSVHEDDNYDGTNIAPPVLATGARQCAAACCANPSCKAFTLNAGTGKRDCYLKSSITHRHNKGCISGIINGSAPPLPPSPPPRPPPLPVPASGYLVRSNTQTASLSLPAAALNAIGSCLVTLSRQQEALRAVSGTWQGERGPQLCFVCSQDAVHDCGCDCTGVTDTTSRLQRCIERAYGHTLPRVPVLLPRGTYLVSDTLTLKQDNPGGDDGINVVPGRFLPHVLVGQPLSAYLNGSARSRPVLKLAASSAGFQTATTASRTGGAQCKPVVDLGSGGVNMNMLFKGIDLDLRAPGNAAACGVYHNGAQGSTVTDVSVRASNDTFSCFYGLNGAGGLHGNIACDGARFGIYVDGAQPVPAAVGARLYNQSISAIVFNQQETLSLVGIDIRLPAWATGPAIHNIGPRAMSLVDVSIVCAGTGQTAIETKQSTYGRDLHIRGCATAIKQNTTASLLPPSPTQWLHVAEYAKGAGGPDSQGYLTDVIYPRGQRQVGGLVSRTATGPPPPQDLIDRHLWSELTFPDMGASGVANARTDCGAKGDSLTDDTVALQACLTRHTAVFLPPGLYRISDTLTLNAGGSLVGWNNAVSVLLAASAGFSKASLESPRPMLRTAEDTGPNAKPTILAFIGVVTWQHLADVFTLDWRTQHPKSVWRTNFESRDCECLWLSAYQQLAPTIVPCSMPVNITTPKSVFRGLGRVYSFVNDDTGAIVATSASYRSLMITNVHGTSTQRLRLYSLNLEHAQTESNGEVRASSFVDIYSVKGEGNTPMLWLRKDVKNVSVLGFGGDPTAFPFNFTQPSDFAQLSPSMFRVEKGAQGVTLAALLDHGFGTGPPSWPPRGWPHGNCHWTFPGHYPFPGQLVSKYPFCTWPNCTMWNCWSGSFCSTAYYWMVSDGLGEQGVHSSPTDKPIFWQTLKTDDSEVASNVNGDMPPVVVSATPDAYLQAALEPWRLRGKSWRGWTGGDVGASAALTPNKTLWVFGDTLIGRWDNAKRQRVSEARGHMPHSSIGVWDLSKSPSALGAMTWHWGSNDSSFFRPSWEKNSQPGRQAFWAAVTSPRAVGGRVLVIGNRVLYTATGGPMGFEVNEMIIFSVDGATERPDTPDTWKLTHFALPHTGNLSHLPSKPLVDLARGVLLVGDGLDPVVYLYGYVSLPGKLSREVVSRIGWLDLQAQNFSAQEYWVTGGRWQTGWSDDLPQSMATLWQPQIAEMQVQWSELLGVWVVVDIPFMSTAVEMRTAPAPEGPWSKPEIVYHLPSPQNDTSKFFCYSAMQHDPASLPLSPSAVEGDVVFTFVCNGRTLADVFAPGAETSYVPQFVRLRLSQGH